VAYLVKALSAIGVQTFNSCDGHGTKKMIIVETPEKYSAAFIYALITEYLMRKMTLMHCWSVSFATDGTGRLTVKSNVPQDTIAQLYFEIYRAANEIYEERIMLRDVRRQINAILDQFEPQKRNCEELKELTRRLFRDVLKQK